MSRSAVVEALEEVGLGLFEDAAARVGRAAGRLGYWAGRAVGVAEQLRDVALVATTPLVVPEVPWGVALRKAWDGLRGRPVVSVLRLRRMVQSMLIRLTANE